MKKKSIVCLLVIITIIIITGCKNKNEVIEDYHPNQTGYVEGDYFIGNLTFSLYDGFSKSVEDNIYQFADDDNAIAIYFYYDKDVNDSVNNFIKSDPHDFFPNNNVNLTIINGNEWYKCVTNDNAYLYYIQQGSDIYSIMILPMLTNKTTFNEVISTLENSLYFK